MALITFIAGNFKHCLEICSTDFSSVSNSALFEGNLLRLKALALVELHSKHRKTSSQAVSVEVSDSSGSSDRETSIREAITSVENALEIYSCAVTTMSSWQLGSSVQKGSGVRKVNVWGQALSNFHLGYLFKKLNTLVEINKEETKCDAGSPPPKQDLLDKASTHLKKAFKGF